MGKLLTCRLWTQGFPEKAKSKLDDYGFIQSRPKGEVHANNQQMSKLLHKAIGLGGKAKAPQVGPSAFPVHCLCPGICTLRDVRTNHNWPCLRAVKVLSKLASAADALVCVFAPETTCKRLHCWSCTADRCVSAVGLAASHPSSACCWLPSCPCHCRRGELHTRATFSRAS